MMWDYEVLPDSRTVVVQDLIRRDAIYWFVGKVFMKEFAGVADPLIGVWRQFV